MHRYACTAKYFSGHEPRRTCANDGDLKGRGVGIHGVLRWVKKTFVLVYWAMQEPIEWREDGNPFSPRFNDVYRSRANGLAQAQHVFIHGCGLPHAWRGRDEFVVLETGFGLGLNFLATWATWQLDAARSERLHFVSVEAYPVQAQDLLQSAQALNAQAPDAELLAKIQHLAPALALAWQSVQPGVQTWSFDQGRVQLTLGVGDAREMLTRLNVQANAVYLDGFSPARNPDMWRLQTLQAVARQCQHGAKLASYTVAAQVMRDLTALGFEVQKRPGLPPKWGRIEAVLLREPKR